MPIAVGTQRTETARTGTDQIGPTEVIRVPSVPLPWAPSFPLGLPTARVTAEKRLDRLHVLLDLPGTELVGHYQAVVTHPPIATRTAA